MEIKKGNRFVCVKDSIAPEFYTKGNIYVSENDGCITCNKGDKNHRWPDLAEKYFTPYSKLDRVYTKYTDRLYKMYLDYNGYKSEVISKNGDCVFFDNMNMDGETGVFGWAVQDHFALDNGAVYLSEQAFIEFMGLSETADTKLSPQPHYDNSSGSLFSLAEQLQLNHWEFDILKRLVRCRKKGQFKEDLQKIKDTCDIYLQEYK